MVCLQPPCLPIRGSRFKGPVCLERRRSVPYGAGLAPESDYELQKPLVGQRASDSRGRKTRRALRGVALLEEEAVLLDSCWSRVMAPFRLDTAAEGSQPSPHYSGDGCFLDDELTSTCHDTILPVQSCQRPPTPRRRHCDADDAMLGFSCIDGDERSSWRANSSIEQPHSIDPVGPSKVEQSSPAAGAHHPPVALCNHRRSRRHGGLMRS